MYQISLSFYAALFNKRKADPKDLDQDTDAGESSKIKSFFKFSITIFIMVEKRINTHAIYERCKSRELITPLKKQSVCVSYKVMKQKTWQNIRFFKVQMESPFLAISLLPLSQLVHLIISTILTKTVCRVRSMLMTQHQSCSKRYQQK